MCEWSFEPWPRNWRNKRCLGEVGVLEHEDLRSEVRDTDGLCHM